MSPPGHVLGPHGLLDAVHLLLVALAVPHGILLGLLQRALQRLHTLSRGTQALLQLGQLTAQVCIVPDQLQGRNRWGLAEGEAGAADPVLGAEKATEEQLEPPTPCQVVLESA